MPCVIVAIVLMFVPGYVIGGGVYRRLVNAGHSQMTGTVAGVLSFIGTFLAVCVMVAIFLSKFRFTR